MNAHLNKYLSQCPHANEELNAPASILKVTYFRQDCTCLWCMNRYDMEIINAVKVGQVRRITLWDKVKHFWDGMFGARITIRKEIEEGGKIPWGYGVAWRAGYEEGMKRRASE